MKVNFNLIAHRGFSEIAPENTIPSFDLALDHGFISIEFDVQLTKDKIPVVIHDDDTFRTTGYKKIIKQAKYSEISEIQAKNNFNLKENVYDIPLLSDLLIRYKNKSDMHIELKSNEKELSKIVLGELIKNGYDYENSKLFKKGGITISSFNLNQLINMRRLNSKIRTAWLVDKLTHNNIKISNEEGINMICPKAEFSKEDMVSIARSKNLEIRNWGVKNKEDLVQAYNSGSSGTTVDWPETAKNIINDIEN